MFPIIDYRSITSGQRPNNGTKPFFMERKLVLYGLIIECPFVTEKKDCPLHEIRKLSNFDMRIEIIENMSDKEVTRIVSWHNQCQSERETENRNESSSNGQL
jgi:hypothetical protein